MTAPENPPQVTLSLFGLYSSKLDELPHPFLRSKKNRALFAYLVLARSQPVLRSTLASLLWPGYTENSARTNLRQALAQLRRIFTPLEPIKADYEQVRLILDNSQIDCDVLTFDELLSACENHQHISLPHCFTCQERLRQAAALYKGPLLDQFPDLDSSPFEEWRQAQQQLYAARFAEVEAALQASERAAAAPPPSNLSAAPTPLIGRDHEVEKLTTMLLEQTYRCLTLTGIGGSGKTRLALELGQVMRPHFADGTWWVDLSALSPSVLSVDETDEKQNQLKDQIATTISSTLGLAAPGALRPTEHLISNLSERNSLLILDNYEQVSGGAGLVADLLNAAPDLYLLITSRHRLPLQYQQTYHVAGLAWPKDELAELSPSIKLLSDYASLELFAECARRASFEFPLDTANLNALVEICQLVEGLPLAIELAATLLEKQTPRAILETLRRTYGVLQVQVYDMPARQQSMRSVLLAAWELLSPSEAQTLAHCSIFRGGFTLDAAERIAGTTSNNLERLVHKSLLRCMPPEVEIEVETAPLSQHPSPSNVGVRYAIHELVRQFAAEQLEQQPDVAKQIGDCHAAYYTTLLASWQPEGEAERAFRIMVQPEIENVESAWDWALLGEQITLLPSAIDGLVEFYEMEGRYYAVEAILRRSVAQVRSRIGALEETAHEPPLFLSTLLATLLVKLGYVYTIGLAQLQDAHGYANEALALAHSAEDTQLIIHSYCVLSTNAFGEGDYVRAKELGAKALHLAQEHNLGREVMISLSVLGLPVSYIQGQSQPLRYLQQALEMAQAANDTRKTLFYRNQLGSGYLNSGNVSEALRYFKENLPATRRHNDPSQLAFAGANLGFLMLLLGDYGPARDYLEDGYQRFVTIGEKRAASDTLALIGQLLLEQGLYADSITYCERSLTLAKQNSLITAQQMAWLTLGDLYREQGKWQDADIAYEQCIAACGQPNVADIMMLAQCGQASLWLGKNDPPAALATLEELLPKFNPDDFYIYFPAQRFLLFAYQILVANNDSRSATILQQAWQLVQAKADKISDPHLRHSYLSNIPLHRTIIELNTAKK